jgi:ADYC domain
VIRVKQYTRFISILALASCVDDLETSELGDEVLAPNGVSLNGVSLNGVSLGGASLGGLALDSVSFANVKIGTTAVTNMAVVNSLLGGVKSGSIVAGSALVGAVFSGRLSNGTTLPLRLDAVQTLPAPNTDLASYAFSYQTSSGWTSLCGAGVNATASSGTWHPTTTKHQWDASNFTLSCRGSTFTKCLELGYKGDSLLDTYHQACIRALRADYCGDGKANTVNGTEINIYDKLGKQTDTQAWTLEANWTPDGAVCIGRARVVATTGGGVPACIAARAATACATASWGSNLIRTEMKP